MKKIFHRLFIQPSIFSVASILTFISLGIPILFGIIKYFITIFNKDFQLLGFILLCLVMSFNGFIQMYRKEIPGYGFGHSIKGMYAMICGFLLFVFFLLGAIYLIVGRFTYQNNFFKSNHSPISAPQVLQSAQYLYDGRETHPGFSAGREIRLTQGVTPTKYRNTGQLVQAESGLDHFFARWLRSGPNARALHPGG